MKKLEKIMKIGESIKNNFERTFGFISIDQYLVRSLIVGSFVIGSSFVEEKMVNKYFLTSPEKEILESQSSFEEKVRRALRDPSNIKQRGIFSYVDINNDSKYDAVIFPAPVKYGTTEILKLKGGLENEKRK